MTVIDVENLPHTKILVGVMCYPYSIILTLYFCVSCKKCFCFQLKSTNISSKITQIERIGIGIYNLYCYFRVRILTELKLQHLKDIEDLQVSKDQVREEAQDIAVKFDDCYDRQDMILKRSINIIYLLCINVSTLVNNCRRYEVKFLLQGYTSWNWGVM